MNPSVAHLEAFLAALGLWFDGPDLIEVRARFGHVGLLGNLECAVNRNTHAEPRVTGNGLDGDKPAHLLDDTMHEVQAEPGTLAYSFGRKKRVENARLDFGRDSRAIIGDLDE